MKKFSKIEIFILVISFILITIATLNMYTFKMFYNFILLPFVGAISFYYIKNEKEKVQNAMIVYMFILLVAQTFLKSEKIEWLFLIQTTIILYVLLSIGILISKSILYINLEKNKMFFKVIATMYIIVAVASMSFLTEAFVGNPVSKFIVNSAANKYIEEKYPSKDLKVGSVYKDFKDGDYGVRIISDTSKDIRFLLSFDVFGNFKDDNYYTTVGNKFNTYLRVDRQYYEYINNATKSNKIGSFKTDNFKIDALTGTLYSDYFNREPSNGENTKLDVTRYLEIDKEYDTQNIGEKFGVLDLYIYQKEESYDYNKINSFDEISALLLDIKKYFDDNNIKFKYMHITIVSDGDKDSHILNHIIEYDTFKNENLSETLKKEYEQFRKEYIKIKK